MPLLVDTILNSFAYGLDVCIPRLGVHVCIALHYHSQPSVQCVTLVNSYKLVVCCIIKMFSIWNVLQNYQHEYVLKLQTR